MKKILIFSIALAGLTYAGCKKRDSYDVSTIKPESYPTITFTGSKFVSIPTGGTVPNIAATAYDSVYNEVCSVQQGESGVDVNTPGLYFQEYESTNSQGFRSVAIAYVAVTDVSPDVNLAGPYKRTANGAPVTVTKLANGLYSTNDVGGAPTLQVTAYFVHINDTIIDVPYQPTSVGTLGCYNAKLSMTPTDTSFSYVVDQATYFGTALRTFVKQ
jgi:hypothetical protein